MKLLSKTRLEVYSSRLSLIKQGDCTAFILPRSLSLRERSIRNLISDSNRDRVPELRIRIRNVSFKRLNDLTDQEIETLKMDYPDEILDAEEDDCCFLYKHALAHLPNGHPLSWIEEANDFCRPCAEKIVDEIRDACVKKDSCIEKSRSRGCPSCSEIRYQVASDVTSDSGRTCHFSETDDEYARCGRYLHTSLTRCGCEQEVGHFQTFNFDFSSESDRYSIKKMLECIDYPGLDDDEDTQFIKLLGMRATWNTYWGRHHSYKKNPHIGYHTFEVI